MGWHSSFLQKMPALCQNKEGDDATASASRGHNAMHAEITQRWNNFVKGQTSPPLPLPPTDGVVAPSAASPAASFGTGGPVAGAVAGTPAGPAAAPPLAAFPVPAAPPAAAPPAAVLSPPKASIREQVVQLLKDKKLFTAEAVMQAIEGGGERGEGGWGEAKTERSDASPGGEISQSPPPASVPPVATAPDDASLSTRLADASRTAAAANSAEPKAIAKDAPPAKYSAAETITEAATVKAADATTRAAAAGAVADDEAAAAADPTPAAVAAATAGTAPADVVSTAAAAASAAATTAATATAPTIAATATAATATAATAATATSTASATPAAAAAVAASAPVMTPPPSRELRREGSSSSTNSPEQRGEAREAEEKSPPPSGNGKRAAEDSPPRFTDDRVGFSSKEDTLSATPVAGVGVGGGGDVGDGKKSGVVGGVGTGGVGIGSKLGTAIGKEAADGAKGNEAAAGVAKSGGKLPADALWRIVARMNGPYSAQFTVEDVKTAFEGWVEPREWKGGRGAGRVDVCVWCFPSFCVVAVFVPVLPRLFAYHDISFSSWDCSL